MKALPAQGPRYITLEEAGTLCSSPPETVRKWTRSGKLRGYRPGKLLLVREDELRAFLQSSDTVSIRARKRSGLAR
jgi:excisionase family DNA binding protein